jgi:hypothetical protein
VEAVIDPNSPNANQFSFNFKGTLNNNINNAHRYIVEVTVSDKGFPTRTGNALFILPLINYNVNAPQYTPPVVIAAAITLEPGTVLSILNAWHIDGHKFEFTVCSGAFQELTRGYQQSGADQGWRSRNGQITAGFQLVDVQFCCHIDR